MTLDPGVEGYFLLRHSEEYIQTIHAVLDT